VGASYDGNVYQLRISDDRMFGHQKDNVRCAPSLVALAHLHLGGKLTIFKTIAVDASILKVKLLNSFY
jgi:hypothetical protein